MFLCTQFDISRSFGQNEIQYLHRGHGRCFRVFSSLFVIKLSSPDEMEADVDNSNSVSFLISCTLCSISSIMFANRSLDISRLTLRHLTWRNMWRQIRHLTSTWQHIFASLLPLISLETDIVVLVHRSYSKENCKQDQFIYSFFAAIIIFRNGSSEDGN